MRDFYDVRGDGEGALDHVDVPGNSGVVRGSSNGGNGITGAAEEGQALVLKSFQMGGDEASETDGLCARLPNVCNVLAAQRHNL